MTIDIMGKLKTRGLLDEAIKARWEPHTLILDGNQYAGWQYPVFFTDGRTHPQLRWKSAEKTGPKYFWPTGKPAKARYYFLPGLMTVIQRASGLLYIAAGEPDVLAYAAAELPNALCWLAGEGSIPETLVNDLQILGVTSVIYAPDCDVAGMRSAHKLREALNGSGIALSLRALPGDMGSKYDINCLWQDVEFKADAFRDGLAVEIDQIDLELYARESGSSQVVQRRLDDVGREWYREWINDICARLGPADKRAGGIERWHCPLPEHEDNDPSFRVSTDKNPELPWPVCSCGIEHRSAPWDDVALALGAPAWADFKRDKAGIETPARPTIAERPSDEADASPIAWLVSDTMTFADLKSELLDGAKTESRPIAFPFKALHQFGGLAEFLWSGKMVGIGGISGGGKTSFLKCLMQEFLHEGLDVIWWGPEWTPDEYAVQDLQRAGGLTFGEISALRIVRARAVAENKTEEQVMAETGLSVPTPEAIRRSGALLDVLAARRGRMHYITDLSMPVEEVMAGVGRVTRALRADGRTVAAFVFDYAQLAQHPGRQDWTWGTEVIATIKQGIVASQLVGFVGIQSRKHDAEQVRDGNKRLSAGAGQGTKEDPFNLYMTVAPVFKPDGSKEPYVVTRVEKNNQGRTGKVMLVANWPRLTIADRIVDNVHLVADPDSVPEIDE